MVKKIMLTITFLSFSSTIVPNVEAGRTPNDENPTPQNTPVKRGVGKLKTPGAPRANRVRDPLNQLQNLHPMDLMNRFNHWNGNNQDSEDDTEE